jgi:hypothetical protein
VAAPVTSDRPNHSNKASGVALIVAGYACGIASLFVFPPGLALAAVIIGILNLTRKKIGIGTSQIVIAVTCGFIGMIIGAAVGFQNGLQRVLGTGAVSQSAAGLFQSGRGSGPANERPIHVEAADLYADYEANEVGADLKYKNRLLWIEGVIQSVGKDLVDTPYVELEGSGGLFAVQCMFQKGSEAELADLQKGKALIVVGRGAGKLGNVLIKDSVIPLNDPAYKTRIDRLSLLAALRKQAVLGNAIVRESGDSVSIDSDIFRVPAKRQLFVKSMGDLFCRVGFTELSLGSVSSTEQVFSLHCK